MEMPLRLFTVEVRETGTLQLVAAIEILSPVNKQPGYEAYGEYLRKRREMLRSGAHLMEIDFLRGAAAAPGAAGAACPLLCAPEPREPSPQG